MFLDDTVAARTKRSGGGGVITVAMGGNRSLDWGSKGSVEVELNAHLLLHVKVVVIVVRREGIGRSRRGEWCVFVMCGCGVELRYDTMMLITNQRRHGLNCGIHTYLVAQKSTCLCEL